MKLQLDPGAAGGAEDGAGPRALGRKAPIGVALWFGMLQDAICGCAICIEIDAKFVDEFGFGHCWFPFGFWVGWGLLVPP